MLLQNAVLDIQNEFRKIINKIARTYELVNLEIFNCFAEGNFKNANIRMPLLGIEKTVPSDPPTPWIINTIEFDDVFDLRILEALTKIDTLDDKTMDPNLMLAYKSLVNYIAEKEKHDLCLSRICKAQDGSLPEPSSETDIAYALGVHLFGPLTGGSCVVDNHSRSKSCPGGCKATAQKGPTGIGAVQIWHGFADIIVNHKIPVKVWKEVTDVCTAGLDRDSDESSDSETDESPGSTYSSDIMSMKQPLCQLIAQTITNSFAQVNQNKQLSNFLIPAFGCSNKQVVIFGYDSENDILVKKIDPILLWTGTDDDRWHLSVSAVVHIWMYIHFQLLMIPSLTKRCETNIQSNFHKCNTVELFRRYSRCHTKQFPLEERINLLSSPHTRIRPVKKIKLN